MKAQTKSVRIQTSKTSYNEHSTPLFLTSSFTFNDLEHGEELFSETAKGNIYSRFSNPNASEFVEKICALENAEDGQAFATGMSAVFASMSAFLKSGDHIVSQEEVFGSTHQIFNQIFPNWNISHSYVSGEKLEDWEEAFKSNTKIIYLETPSNPGLKLYDIKAISELAKSKGAILIVDNCFATPLLQKPMDLGADIVLHSATKLIDGQGRVLGGVVVGSQEIIRPIRFFARHTGAAISPFNAWLLSKSIETLEVRMIKHCENALKLAKFLETAKGIANTKYPFLASSPQYELAKKQMKHGGAIITIEIEGGFKRTKAFYNALRIPSKTANLGDTRTIVTHPATTTHSKLSDKEKIERGITQNLIRISVGLEHIDDLIEDFAQALVSTA